MTDYEMMSAMADNELDSAERAAAEKQIASDPRSRASFESIRQLKQTLRKLPAHNSPETLKACRARFAEIDRTTKTVAVVERFRYAMAAVLVIAIAGAAYVNRVGGSKLDSDMLSRTLAASLAGGSNVTDDGNASQWIAEQLGRKPAPTLGGLTLWRIDRIHLQDKTIGRQIYTDGTSDYVMLIAPGTDECPGEPLAGSPGVKVCRVGAINAVSWCEGNTSYVFAAEKPVEDLLYHLRK